MLYKPCMIGVAYYVVNVTLPRIRCNHAVSKYYYVYVNT